MLLLNLVSADFVDGLWDEAAAVAQQSWTASRTVPKARGSSSRRGPSRAGGVSRSGGVFVIRGCYIRGPGGPVEQV
jgi:hypothetical protein